METGWGGGVVQYVDELNSSQKKELSEVSKQLEELRSITTEVVQDVLTRMAALDDSMGKLHRDNTDTRTRVEACEEQNRTLSTSFQDLSYFGETKSVPSSASATPVRRFPFPPPHVLTLFLFAPGTQRSEEIHFAFFLHFVCVCVPLQAIYSCGLWKEGRRIRQSQGSLLFLCVCGFAGVWVCCHEDSSPLLFSCACGYPVYPHACFPGLDCCLLQR